MPISLNRPRHVATVLALGLVLASCSQQASSTSSTSTTGVSSSTRGARGPTTRPSLAASPVDWTRMAGAAGAFWLLGTYRCERLTCLVIARSTNGGGSFARVAAPDIRYHGEGVVVTSFVFANAHDGYLSLLTYSMDAKASSTLFWTNNGGEGWQSVKLGGQLDSPIVATQRHAYALITTCLPSTPSYCPKLALASSAVSSSLWRVRPVLTTSRRYETSLAAFGANVWIALAGNGGLSSRLLMSSDGGIEFSALAVRQTEFGFGCDITATSSITLWGNCAAGMAGWAMRSTNGGRSFSRLGWSPNAENVNTIVPLSNLVAAYEIPASRHLWVTRDGGRRFTQVLTMPFPQGRFDIAFAGAKIWLAWATSLSGHGGERLWRSSDGGYSWTRVSLPALRTVES